MAQIAPGLAALINDSDAVLKLLVSPEISDVDQAAIRRGVSEPREVLDEALVNLFERARLSASAVERHTVATLSYLIASERLDMRVVLMEKGMYHKKMWLLRSGEDWLAVHGSGNATERGLLVNGEQMAVDRAWMDGDRARDRVELFINQWDTQWHNLHPTSLTVEVDRALSVLRKRINPTGPTVADFWDAWHQDAEAGLEPKLPAGYVTQISDHRLSLPANLVWREGRFAHQGLAVDALLRNRGGIISMATGGGKTKTALIAASKIQSSLDMHLCVLVLAPTRPLLKQWVEDVREFGIEPIVLSGIGDEKRRMEMERASIGFGTAVPRNGGLRQFEFFVCSPQTGFQRMVRELAFVCNPPADCG